MHRRSYLMASMTMTVSLFWVDISKIYTAQAGNLSSRGLVQGLLMGHMHLVRHDPHFPSATQTFLLLVSHHAPSLIPANCMPWKRAARNAVITG